MTDEDDGIYEVVGVSVRYPGKNRLRVGGRAQGEPTLRVG
jgi:hypothetical protein